MSSEINNINDLKILYVEDDKLIRTGVVEMLSRKINNLLVATNGKEGFRVFVTEKPDMVITDIRMPQMNGLEMSRKIKRKEKDTQIIVTSAHSDTSYFVDAIDIGINQYVLKPISREKLFEAINKSYELIKLQKKVKHQFQTIMKLYQAIEQSNSLIIITDANMKISYVNPRFLEVTGYSLSEVLNIEKNVSLEKISTLGKTENVLKTLKNGEVWKGEYKNRKKTGESFWELGSITPVKNEKDQITSFVNVSEDITELKKVSEELKASEDKHRSLIESLGEGIGILDLSYDFTFGNPAMEDIFGTNNIVGRNLSEFSRKEQFKVFVEKSKISQQEKKQFELLIITGDQEEKVMNVTLTPQLDKLGKKTIGSFCIFQDITQIKMLIEQKDDAIKAAELAYDVIEEKNHALNELNAKLKKSEEKLSELNKVLVEYIKATGK